MFLPVTLQLLAGFGESLKIFLLTLLFAWFVNFVMGRKLERISMTESLKSVD